MPTFSELELNVVRWSEARGIIPNSTPQAQTLKAVEEMGELASAVAKGRTAEAQDAIGDITVCLINVCALLDVPFTACLDMAWQQIKDRKGYMTPEGIFVKET